mmetsp:Transcript_1203/g.1890  ORF Transcript_1203/g.1890 Transcript_1203/m.1890 type:complete len:400 (+) Transcript_1203:139-1338(+)|eukprot:CAMPEP_0184556184 /NCGR_PEP_ID=MMETSP0199_2-20130426/39503_1 /TAXON_ID=1112570 /ORGANISM="Thraustochytrium sp., Strain LLF1b" /LENGTH=399 /DNA_ID=CAMNT_0026952731 /DNA_START=73 /DNA_END=1272 /DNA_ORIENTATION=-
MTDAVTVCVTGGAGFLGSQICHLLAEGKHLDVPVKEVRVLDLRKPTGKAFETFHTEGTPTLVSHIGSINDIQACARAFTGVDVVIHTASLVDFGNASREQLLFVNHRGTGTVLAACRNCSVKCVVYTSSLDAVTTWGHDTNKTSDTPYLSEKGNGGGVYGHSKALAEKEVLAADSALMRTTALRMRGLYGEGDPFYMTNLIRMTAKGLNVMIGDGTAVSDNIYVGNVAYAHLCAVNALLSPEKEKVEAVAGRPLHISHEKPCSMYQKSDPFLKAFGLQQPWVRVPWWMMYTLAVVLASIFSLIPRAIRPPLLLTPSSVTAIGYNKTFIVESDLDRLRFKPLYSEEEATARTLAWLQHEWPDRPNTSKNTHGIPTNAITMLGVVALGAIAYANYGTAGSK